MVLHLRQLLTLRICRLRTHLSNRLSPIIRLFLLSTDSLTVCSSLTVNSLISPYLHRWQVRSQPKNLAKAV